MAVNRNDDRWIFTKEQLGNTPSVKHGYTEERESAARQQAANLIQNMGQKMKLSQLCMNTAIVYMRRFYMFQSMQRFPYKRMASAFIFLAAKVEEQPKKIEYVITTYYCLHNKSEDGRPIEVDQKSQDYLEKVQELVINENVLLQTLGFNVTIDHSNTHVVKLCQLVKAPKELSQLSYFLSTNSLLLTNFCLQYGPQTIAATCIHLACKWADWELQRSKEGKVWWHYLAPKMTSEDLEASSKRFLSVMEKADPKLKNQLLGQLKQQSAESSPNSRSASPAPFGINRPSHSQHGTPHRAGTPHRVGANSAHSHHSHNNYTPDRGHSSKSAVPPSQETGSAKPSIPAKTYAEHRERSRLAVPEQSSKPGSHHIESPLARSDLKRSYPKDAHLPPAHNSSGAMTSKPLEVAHQAPHQAPHTVPAPLYNNNPYAKQSRSHDSSKSRHHNRHHTGSSIVEHSPQKRPRIAGENGNGEHRPPLPPQPPQPRPPPPP